MSVNKVILVGNVGQDPEIRSTNDGKEIANFSIATTESWKDKITGERKDKTEWHRVVIFSQGLVGVVKNYVKKGSKLYIEGQLQTRKWTDNSGVERYTTEVVLQNFNSSLQMLDSRANANSGDAANYNNPSPPANSGQENYQPSTNQQTANKSFNEELADDDIPF